MPCHCYTTVDYCIRSTKSWPNPRNWDSSCLISHQAWARRIFPQVAPSMSSWINWGRCWLNTTTSSWWSVRIRGGWWVQGRCSGRLTWLKEMGRFWQANVRWRLWMHKLKCWCMRCSTRMLISLVRTHRLRGWLTRGSFHYDFIGEISEAFKINR